MLLTYYPITSSFRTNLGLIFGFDLCPNKEGIFKIQPLIFKSFKINFYVNTVKVIKNQTGKLLLTNYGYYGILTERPIHNYKIYTIKNYSINSSKNSNITPNTIETAISYFLNCYPLNTQPNKFIEYYPEYTTQIKKVFEKRHPSAYTTTFATFDLKNQAKILLLILSFLHTYRQISFTKLITNIRLKKSFVTQILIYFICTLGFEYYLEYKNETLQILKLNNNDFKNLICYLLYKAKTTTYNQFFQKLKLLNLPNINLTSTGLLKITKPLFLLKNKQLQKTKANHKTYECFCDWLCFQPDNQKLQKSFLEQNNLILAYR